MRLHRTQLQAIAEQQRAGVPPHEVVVPAAPPKRKRDNEEWRIQCAFFRWWWSAAKRLGVWPGLCFHIPNSSFLSGTKSERQRRGQWANMAGVTTGVPDVFLAVPGSTKVDDLVLTYAGLWIEFKKPSERTKKNGGLSDSQQEFLAYAIARGYHCEVAYSWEEGRDHVLKYLKNERRQQNRTQIREAT
jgi:hypothetical protein